MARMPGAEWVGEHGSVGMTEASLNKVCLHTIVGNPPAHAAHFSVRADGHIFQSRDTKWRSAANLYGNDDVIAIENDDHGPEYGAWNTKNGHAVPGYTDAQMWGNAKILAWAYHTHGIPLRQCPDSKDGSEGIAYHRQGVDGNFWAEGYAYGGRVAGGEEWSTSYGKVCPGDRRISQQPIIINRARQLAGLEIPQENEDEMKPILVQEKTKPEVWLGNYIERRWVQLAELPHLKDRFGEVELWALGTIGVLGFETDESRVTRIGTVPE